MLSTLGLSALADQNAVGPEAGAGAPSQCHLGRKRSAPRDCGGAAGPGADPGEAGPGQRLAGTAAGPGPENRNTLLLSQKDRPEASAALRVRTV